jgi:hypothetical protein
MKNINKQQKNNSAFTVLFAVIVSSLILALGLGIVAITMKEVKLSGAGRDSQLAFYSADSGLECAMYWDLRGDFFATSSDSSPQGIKCNKLATTTTILPSGANSATSTFRMCMGIKGAVGSEVCDDTKPCADVAVSKVTESGTTTTAIDSRGYNSCDANNQRRLERGYRVVY